MTIQASVAISDTIRDDAEVQGPRHSLFFMNGTILFGGDPVKSNARRTSLTTVETMVVVGVMLSAGCGTGFLDDLLKRERQEDVEVSPGQWLSVTRTDWCYSNDAPIGRPTSGERTSLVMAWNKDKVSWESVAIPISLRESDGTLYIIGYDRETDPRRERLRYYRLNGTMFTEIKPAEFPKQIATQNMWIKADSYSIGMDGKKHYELEMTKQLDPDNIYFGYTCTAHIWAHLLTGKDYDEHDSSCVSRETLKEYKDTFRPIPLPTIIRPDVGEAKK